MRKRYKKSRKPRILPRILSVALVLLVLCGIYGFLAYGPNPFDFSVPTLSELFPPEKHIASMEHGWNLILVNSDNYIPEGFTGDMTELWNGEQVDSRIYPALQEMFDDARAEGVYMVVRAGFRTQEVQQALMDERIRAFEDEGCTHNNAVELAKEWVAVPGTSEHQLGIAVDINQDPEKSTADEIYAWLSEHAWEYGFIYRYPPDKTEITGISNEPWHYRYVGEEAAREITQRGLCLEEYIAELDAD